MRLKARLPLDFFWNFPCRYDKSLWHLTLGGSRQHICSVFYGQIFTKTSQLQLQLHHQPLTLVFERKIVRCCRSFLLAKFSGRKIYLWYGGGGKQKRGRPKLWQTTMLRTFWNRTLLITKPLLTSQKKPKLNLLRTIGIKCFWKIMNKNC